MLVSVKEVKVPIPVSVSVSVSSSFPGDLSLFKVGLELELGLERGLRREPASRYPGSASKFSATLQTNTLSPFPSPSPSPCPCPFLSVNSLAERMRFTPSATEGATGFSLKTCLPALSDLRMKDGWSGMGSMRRVAFIEGFLRRLSNG